MATRRQQVLIAILTPLALAAVIVAGSYYMLETNPTEAAKKRRLKALIAEKDRAIKAGRDAAKQAKKREKPKTVRIKPKPVDPIDWTPDKIRALRLKEGVAEVKRAKRQRDRKSTPSGSRPPDPPDPPPAAIRGHKGIDAEQFAEQMMTILAAGTRDQAWKATVNLAVLENDALPALQDGFTHDEAKVRYFSLRSVSLMKDARVPLKAMQPLAKDSDPQVRCALARALGRRLKSFRHSDKQMDKVRQTLAALLDDQEPIVRSAVASVLERARLEKMAGPLLKALDRKSIGREEQNRICSALESTFSLNVGIEYLPAPSLPADQDRRVQRWREWGKRWAARKKTIKGGATADAEGVD